MSKSVKTTLLLILDGWGHTTKTDHNAIAAAKSPTWDSIWNEQPATLIATSGNSVGLPEDQMGNSEVGHMNMGAGRVVYQSLTRIDKDIAEGRFTENAILKEALDKAVSKNSTVHLLGLLSPGGIHCHENHIFEAIRLASNRGCQKVLLHAFLDGRDTPPRSAMNSLIKADRELKTSGLGGIATICGRFYAMDRDNRWDRIKPAYELLTESKSEFSFKDVDTALNAAYERGEDDEFVKPTLVGAREYPPISDNDVVIFMNFRADRARQLTRVFVDESFIEFERSRVPKLSEFVMLTEYSADISAPCAYPLLELENVLGAHLSNSGKKQLRIAETEKYAHVTFFFNGGREEPFENEHRILIPSPDVATYDLKPEMSAPEVTSKLVEAIVSNRYDAIICNYANGDMVGHTGNFAAAVEAVEVIDSCLKEIINAIKEVNGQLIVTADHGNVEQMLDTTTNQPLTSHTKGPVPLVYVGNKKIKFKTLGSLCDIAPTVLALMDMPIPNQMTGTVLVEDT